MLEWRVQQFSQHGGGHNVHTCMIQLSLPELMRARKAEMNSVMEYCNASGFMEGIINHTW